MKFLIINTEAFSPKGVKQRVTITPSGKKKKLDVTLNDLPWVIRKFLSVFSKPFIILDEASKIKTNTAMAESDKSTRTRIIKLLNKFGHRCIMSGTFMSKSPLNLVDPYGFLREGYFPENMWEFAERYCVMMTIRVGRGRRVLINQNDWKTIRMRLKNAYLRGGELQLEATKGTIFRQYAIDYAKQEHIIKHREYTPFLNKAELIKRIAPDTIFVERKDIFDVSFDKFVKEPIMRSVELSSEAKRIGNQLVELGFTDNLTLGKSAALELQPRLQDVCNGFEPIKNNETGEITYRKLKENPKLDGLMELLDEIGVEHNQVAVWSSRKLLIKACGEAFEKAGISYTLYDGGATNAEKEEAERKVKDKEVQVFLGNQASGAYGLNCLKNFNYKIILCVDGSVERHYQVLHRILRGQLIAPKFAYGLYVKGSLEERQWKSLRVGQELISTDNGKDIFQFL